MTYHEKIMQNESVPSQIKDYVSMVDMIKNNVQKSLHSSELIPDILWITDASCKDKLEMLCGYLEEAKVVDFVGENRYINIRIEPINSAEKVSYALNQINDTLILASGFRGDFKGVICIDVQSVKHFGRDFEMVMKHIKENSRGCIRVVMGSCNNEKALDIEQALMLSGYRVHTVREDCITADAAKNFLGIKLDDYGFKLDLQAEEVLDKNIKTLIENYAIRGLDDVNNLYYDMLFFLLRNNCSEKLTVAMLEEYFSQCILLRKTKKDKYRIGFIGSREE